MGRPRSTRPTDAELEILHVFWRNGEASVRDVVDDMTRRKKVAYTSVATLIRIMVRKGLIRLADARRPQRFAATVTQDSTSESIVSDLKQRVFGGSTSALVRAALRGKKIPAVEIAEIRQLVKELV